MILINYNHLGETLLTQALIDKKFKFANKILNNSTEIKKPNRNGFKPIFFAMDNYEVSKLLVESGAELDSIDSDNNSIFHWPLNRNKLELFYSVNSSIINKRNNEGIPPLIASLIRRDSVQFANLLEIGASPSVSDSNGKYAMSYAAELSKHTHWAMFLRKAGGDVNQRNHDGTTPIFFVQTNKMMQYLIKWGAEVDVEDSDRQTPVHYYVVNDRMEVESFELIISFLDRFIVDKLDDKGETAIMYAAQENLEKKFFILYNKFESKNYQFRNPKKVLEYAKLGGNQRIIRTVEHKVFRQTGNRYASTAIASTAYKRGSRSAAAAGLRRITAIKLIQKGVGKVLSRAIPIVGTVLLVKDIYDLIKN